MKAVLLLGAIILVVFFARFVLRLPQVTIHTITVEGAAAVPKGEIEGVAREAIAGDYLYLFPRASIFLYSKTAVVEALLKKYRRIVSASVGFLSPTKIAVRVTERAPTAIFCTSDSLATVTVNTSCYFMDADGFVFDTASPALSSLYFTYFGKITAEDAVGQTYLPAKEFSDLGNFVGALKKRGVAPIALSLSPDDDFTVYLAGGARLLFSRRAGFAVGLQNFDTVAGKLLGAAAPRLDYADFRFGNKVFYKSH